MSIEAQLIELKEFIRNHLPDVIIVEEFTEARTAKETGRPVFNKMISLIERGAADGIISWHPDRLARNSVDGGKIIYLIDKGLIKHLYFPTHNFDNTPQGKFMLNIIFGQSKYYVDNLSENVKRGIRHKLRRGEFPGLAPLGYINNPKTRNIEQETQVAPQIRALFEEYAAGGKTLDDIGDKAAFLGLYNKRSGTKLAKGKVLEILKNPVYCGLIRHNGEIFEGKFEPIISRELFNKTQEVLQSRAKPRKAKHLFVYRSLFKCGVCGCSITAEVQKGHNYYRCTKKKDSKCNIPYLREEKLTAQIHEALNKIIVSVELINYLKEKMKQEKVTLQNSCQAETDKTDKALNNAENRLSRLLDLYLENNISKREYCQRKEKMFNEKYKLQKELEHLQRGQFLWLELLESFINSIDEPENVLNTDNLQKKREFVEKVGSNFTFGLAG